MVRTMLSGYDEQEPEQALARQPQVRVMQHDADGCDPFVDRHQGRIHADDDHEDHFQRNRTQKLDSVDAKRRGSIHAPVVVMNSMKRPQDIITVYRPVPGVKHEIQKYEGQHSTYESIRDRPE